MRSGCRIGGSVESTCSRSPGAIFDAQPAQATISVSRRMSSRVMFRLCFCEGRGSPPRSVPSVVRSLPATWIAVSFRRVPKSKGRGSGRRRALPAATAGVVLPTPFACAPAHHCSGVSQPQNPMSGLWMRRRPASSTCIDSLRVPHRISMAGIGDCAARNETRHPVPHSSSQRAIYAAGFPPAKVKLPPTYKLPPKGRSAKPIPGRLVSEMPEPRDRQEVPSKRAIW